MKVNKYFLKHKGKVIGIFCSKSTCVEVWNKLISKDISKIDDYRIIQDIVEEDDLSIYNLLEAE